MSTGKSKKAPKTGPTNPKKADDPFSDTRAVAVVAEQVRAVLDSGSLPPVGNRNSPRCLAFVMNRESAGHTFVQICAETYRISAKLPGVKHVGKLELEPFESKVVSVNGEDLAVARLRNGTAEMSLFRYRGVWHGWSIESAAMKAENGFNDWVGLFLAVIEVLRPQSLYMMTLARLVRSRPEARRIAHQIEGRVNCVVTASGEMWLTGPRAEVDFERFQREAHEAAADRDAIVLRLARGRADSVERSGWAHGEMTVPVGYKLRKKCLVPDPAEEEAARAMIRILGTDASMREKARLLDEAGVRSGARPQDDNAHRPFLASRNYAQKIERLYRWASIYLYGETLYRTTVPLEHLDSLAGVELVHHASDHRRYGQFQQIGVILLPPNAWGSELDLQRFRQRAQQVITRLNEREAASRPQSARQLGKHIRKKGADPTLWLGGTSLATSPVARVASRARSKIWPFSGRRWVDHSYFYEVRATESNRYAIYRWPLDTCTEDDAAEIDAARRGLANSQSRSGVTRTMTSGLISSLHSRQIVGRGISSEFNLGLVLALAEAIERGIDVSLRPGGDVFSPPDRGAPPSSTLDEQVAQLEAQAEKAARKAQRAQEFAIDADSRDEGRRYRDRARAEEARAAELRHRASKLREAAQPQSLPETIDVTADVWLPALASLVTPDGRVSQAQSSALDEVVRKFSMSYRDGVWWAQATVVMNTAQGVVELGPVEWPACDAGSGYVYLAEPALPTERRDRTAMAHELVSTGGLSEAAAAAAVNCPFPALPYVLLHRLTGTDVPDWVAADWMDEAWSAWLVKAYSRADALAIRSDAWLIQHNNFRSLAPMIAARAGQITDVEVRHLQQGARQALRRFCEPATGDGRPWTPSLVSLTEVPAGLRRLPKGTVAAFGPVHCECKSAVRIVARVPEIPGGMLCDCGRMPGSEKVTKNPELVAPKDYQRLLPREQDLEGAIVFANEQAVRYRLPEGARRVLLAADRLGRQTSATELTRITQRSCTTAVQRLVQLGLLEARPDQSGTSNLSITESGRAKARELRRVDQAETP